MKPKSENKEIRLLWDELAYIGRYMDGISPKTEKYQELAKKKEELRKKLKLVKKSLPLSN